MPCMRYMETRRFYAKVLGLTVASEGRSHVFFDLGGSKLALVDVRHGDRDVQPNGHGIYVDFVVYDLVYIKRQLGREQIRLVDERSDAHGKAITVKDPEGNLVNLFQEGTVD